MRLGYRYLDILALLIVAAVCTSPLAAAPRMVLSETEFNFGFVPQNSKVSHLFWIKSAGQDSLLILSVKPGCSCTQAPLARRELAPGDSVEFEITFATGENIGEVAKHPKLTTNAGPDTVKMTIASNVLKFADSTAPITIKPYRLYVSRVDTIENDEAKFTIRNVTDKEIGVTVISQPPGYFQLTLPPTIPGGQTVDCRLIVNRKYLGEPFERSITLELNDPAKTRFTIPVIRKFIGAHAENAASQPKSKAPKSGSGK